MGFGEQKTEGGEDMDVMWKPNIQKILNDAKI